MPVGDIYSFNSRGKVNGEPYIDFIDAQADLICAQEAGKQNFNPSNREYGTYIEPWDRRILTSGLPVIHNINTRSRSLDREQHRNLRCSMLFVYKKNNWHNPRTILRSDDPIKRPVLAIDRKDGNNLTVFNIHFGGVERINELFTYLKRFQLRYIGKQIIIIGDWNQNPETVRELIMKAGLHLRIGVRQTMNRTHSAGRKLDFAVVSNNWEVERCVRAMTTSIMLSDHYPIRLSGNSSNSMEQSEQRKARMKRRAPTSVASASKRRRT